MKMHYPSNGEESLHHIPGGRKLGTKDYFNAHESKHLNKHEKKESHFKHDFLLHEKE